MRKLLYLFLALALVMGAASCKDKKQKQDDEQKQAQLDDLNAFLDIVAINMDSINAQEQNLFVGRDGMRLSSKERIQNNLKVFRETLDKQRARIATLERDLQNKNDQQSRRLRSVIASLKQQLEEKDAKIAKLEKELQKKDADIASLTGQVNDLNANVTRLNTHVSDLNEHVTTLNTQVETLDEQNQQKDQVIAKQEAQVEELTTGYVKMGTKSNLVSLGILKGNGLAKKKFDANNVNSALFQKVNTTQAQSFTIPGRKPEIMTQHPAGSYTLTDTKLTIVNPKRFWSISHYLVVKYK